MSLAPMMSSVRQSWNTPRVVLDLLAPLGGILLDPCSNPNSVVDAAFSLSLENGNNGLTWPWAEFQREAEPDPGIVYVNSEYGRALPRWIDKCAAEAKLGAEIVALTPARSDTRWWSTAWSSASAVAFWRGRLTFLGAPAPAPFPSALIYWGPRPLEFACAVKSRCHVALPGGGR